MPDEDLKHKDPDAREEVINIRNLLRNQVSTTVLPDRFLTFYDGPRVVITDLKTERSTKVGLYAYSEVIKVLQDLLADD